VNLLLSIASTIVPPPASDALAACGAGIGSQHPILVMAVAAAGTTGLAATLDLRRHSHERRFLVNRTKQNPLMLNSTGAFAPYTMSPAASMTLPAGNSVITITPQSSFRAIDLEDLAVSAIQIRGSVSSTPLPPPRAATPQLTVSAASLRLRQRDGDADGVFSRYGELRCDHRHKLHDRNSEFPGDTEPESIAGASGTVDRTFTYVDRTAVRGATNRYEVTSVDSGEVAGSPSNKLTALLWVSGNMVSTIEVQENKNDLIVTHQTGMTYSSNPAITPDMTSGRGSEIQPETKNTAATSPSTIACNYSKMRALQRDYLDRPARIPRHNCTPLSETAIVRYIIE
jgi:hypothetical protein